MALGRRLVARPTHFTLQPSNGPLATSVEVEWRYLHDEESTIVSTLPYWFRNAIGSLVRIH
jgi:hypothetical protein